MTVPKLARLRDEIVDREAIRDCIYRYCRGVDRCDEEMLRSVYWEGAHDDHVIFSGSGEEFVAWVLPMLRGLGGGQHTVGNILIRLHGDRADVESYYHGFHRVSDGKKVFDSVQAGRYLDRFEKRDDEWRIASRKVMIDWFREYDDTGDWGVGPMGHAGIKPGGFHPDDPSYDFLDLS